MMAKEVGAKLAKEAVARGSEGGAGPEVDLSFRLGGTARAKGVGIDSGVATVEPGFRGEHASEGLCVIGTHFGYGGRGKGAGGPCARVQNLHGGVPVDGDHIGDNCSGCIDIESGSQVFQVLEPFGDVDVIEVVQIFAGVDFDKVVGEGEPG